MLQVEDLKKQYVSDDGTPGGGVFGISFDIAEGELFTLLGPSGCGKTTTLRSIAGLELPDRGRISLSGTDLYNSATRVSVPMYDRDIGMVFQSYAIWPHMNVFNNAAYPLRVSKTKTYSAKQVHDKVTDILEMVGLGDLIRRPSTQLSGGQQQRLALARALTREPQLLLLDEPLSNLDAQLREQMRGELKRLQQEWGVTTVYVTHDQSEALAISDRIAVMNEGVIMQVGTPREIYNRPTSEFVAHFIGKTNLIYGELAADVVAGALADVVTEFGPLRCTFPAAIQATKNIAVVIRPEKVVIARQGGADSGGISPVNQITGVVRNEMYLGEMMEYVVATEKDTEIVVRSPPDRDLSTADHVLMHFPPEATVALIES
ncbi:MAG: ABC transporter ATP-binding protein [Alphaproteobacteria bacterium]|nr:ABC transporter ATP-binding protein [Alphaproteobacteria bacterium]